jgi:hypothetical protein
MLLDYVRDYQKRGDAALIEYSDQSHPIRVAEEQQALWSGSNFLEAFLLHSKPKLTDVSRPAQALLVANAIVWSKIKFGLKPVLAINHIMVYKLEHEVGPQIVVASKQIYANHYFDSSLALTAFGSLSGKGSGSYLFYENRSRADGLDGAFSSIKRGIVEDKAVSSLKTILDTSRVNLNARTLRGSAPTLSHDEEPNWRRWTVGKVHVFVWLGLLSAFIALFALGNYGWKASLSGQIDH